MNGVRATCLWRSNLIILHAAEPLDLCCDNCIRRKHPARRFQSIYDLIGFLDTSFGRAPISRPVDDNNSDLGSTISPKVWGDLRSGNRLTARRRALEDWRYDCWKRDYALCSWGAVGVLSDPMLSKLASSVKIETLDDLLEAASAWCYASKYGHEVLLLLKDTDCEQQRESQERRVKTTQANKKRKLEDRERDERQQDMGGSTHYGPLPAPMALIHTRMINPIIVKEVQHPTQPRPSHPRPQPTPISRPYTRTDVFDSLMDKSKSR